MVTLEHQRSRRAFIAVERAARDAGNLAIGVERFAVEDDGDETSRERDLEFVPGVGSTREGFFGAKPPVEAAGLLGEGALGESSSIWSS